MLEQSMDPLECVRQYHQQSKHRFDKYADGPQTIDWDNQPDPFRTYNGTAQIELPLPVLENTISFGDLYKPQTLKQARLNLEFIGTLLAYSLGLSAWKEYQGSRWSLRCNPSSGNLHPTEAYVIVTGLPDITDGIYHYDSYAHMLEQRCQFTNTDPADTPTLLIGLSSIHWREAWKYGERAFRYSQLDTGHAIACLGYSAAMLGWSVTINNDFSDQDISTLLGLDREEDYQQAERESPEMLVKITASNHDKPVSQTLLDLTQQGQWTGKANVLDNKHLYQWPIIDQVATATAQPATTEVIDLQATFPAPLDCTTNLEAGIVIQRRRSAQTFDALTTIEASQLYRILDMTLPRPDVVPWNIINWTPKIHLILFIHRVDGLESGLYALLRNPQSLDSMKKSMSEKMQWCKPANTPAHLPFYKLISANSQKASARLSCHQRIASDGVLSLGMLSEFDRALENGAWAYPRLFREAGMLGQVLYLEAEAIDLQGTGIGCFFDDAFHEMLGITDTRYQSLYHFTLGGALNDARLRTLPPYQHIQR